MASVNAEKSCGLGNQQARFQRWNKLQRPSRKGVRPKRGGNARDPRGSRYGLISRETVSSPQGRRRNDHRMSPLCSIYGLSSTENGVVRYIGQTTRPLETRLQLHLAEATRPPGTSHCHRWIRKVIRSGFGIQITLIEANCLWDVAEKRWIAEYRKRQPGLMTNISDGGCGFLGKHSAESIERMRGPKSKEHRDKIVAHLLSAETRRKVALGQIGNTKGRGERNGQAILSEVDVIEIIKQLQNRMSLTTLAKKYGVTKAAISKIRTGRTWRHLQRL